MEIDASLFVEAMQNGMAFFLGMVIVNHEKIDIQSPLNPLTVDQEVFENRCKTAQCEHRLSIGGNNDVDGLTQSRADGAKGARAALRMRSKDA